MGIIYYKMIQFSFLLHKCIKWVDYEITRVALEEADTLCHGNWIEIQNLYQYIDKLHVFLIENGIEIPPDSPI